MIRALLIAAIALFLSGAAAAPSTPPRAPEKGAAVVASSPVDLGCRAGSDDRRSDLCAQWKAADAAHESAQWTARSFWLAIVGTVIGGGTLLAAFLAARYARKAAHEAARSANIAAEAYAASERAWLNVDISADSDLRFHPTGGCGIFVKLKITNIGRTPALNAHTSMTMVPSHEFSKEQVAAYAAENRERNEKWSRTVLPGESYDRKWGLHLDDARGTLYGMVLGCVTYETLPDRSLHQTSFCYFLGRGDVGGLNEGDIPQSEVNFTVTTGGSAD